MKKELNQFKVALCISGQMRSYKACYKSLKKNIIDVFSPDIFIHTWSVSGTSNNLDRLFKPEDFQKLAPKYKEHVITENILKKLYSPKAIIIEDYQKEFSDYLDEIKVPDILKEVENDNYKGTLPMYYKIWKCNELKKKYELENHFKYDLVIRIRPDIELLEKLPLALLYGNSDSFFRFTYHHGKYPGKFFTDQIAVGSSHSIDYYSSIFLFLKKYWEVPLGNKKELLDNGFSKKDLCDYPFNLCHRVGERISTYHMIKYKKSIIDINTKFRLKRIKLSGLKLYKYKLIKKIIN